MGFANVTEEHAITVAHFETIRQAFRELLSRPDERPALVTLFQQGFNAVDADARGLKVWAQAYAPEVRLCCKHSIPCLPTALDCGVRS